MALLCWQWPQLAGALHATSLAQRVYYFSQGILSSPSLCLMFMSGWTGDELSHHTTMLLSVLFAVYTL